MTWCETQRVDYVLGLAKNNRLNQALEGEMVQAKQQHAVTGKAARVFKDCRAIKPARAGVVKDGSWARRSIWTKERIPVLS